jgi:hypothetical protein
MDNKAYKVDDQSRLQGHSSKIVKLTDISLKVSVSIYANKEAANAAVHELESKGYVLCKSDLSAKNKTYHRCFSDMGVTWYTEI